MACLLKHIFPDCFNAEKSRLKDFRSQNKSAHRIIVGFVGARYMSIVLGNHPIPVLKLQRIQIEGVRDGVTE